MHLHWRRSRSRASASGYASKWNGDSRRCCPGRIALKKKSAGCCVEAEMARRAEAQLRRWKIRQNPITLRRQDDGWRVVLEEKRLQKFVMFLESVASRNGK